MDIVFNGVSDLSSIVWNGNPLSAVYMNGIQVWGVTPTNVGDFPSTTVDSVHFSATNTRVQFRGDGTVYTGGAPWVQNTAHIENKEGAVVNWWDTATDIYTIQWYLQVDTTGATDFFKFQFAVFMKDGTRGAAPDEIDPNAVIEFYLNGVLRFSETWSTLRAISGLSLSYISNENLGNAITPTETRISDGFQLLGTGSGWDTTAIPPEFQDLFDNYPVLASGNNQPYSAQAKILAPVPPPAGIEDFGTFNSANVHVVGNPNDDWISNNYIQLSPFQLGEDDINITDFSGNENNAGTNGGADFNQTSSNIYGMKFSASRSDIITSVPNTSDITFGFAMKPNSPILDDNTSIILVRDTVEILNATVATLKSYGFTFAPIESNVNVLTTSASSTPAVQVPVDVLSFSISWNDMSWQSADASLVALLNGLIPNGVGEDDEVLLSNLTITVSNPNN